MGIVNRVVGVAECRPHPKNYNRHSEAQVGDLCVSLRRFGQVRSIVVQENGKGEGLGARDEERPFLLVAGEGVWTAAQRVGLEELRADVIPGDWEPVLVEAYLAADNELARAADPDEAQLALLVAAVKERADEELARLAAGTAERLRELEERLKRAQTKDPGPKVDDMEGLQAKWGVEVGQIWEIGRHRLGCGDSTDRQFLAALFGDEQPWMGLTSPPYWVGKEYERTTTFAEHLELLAQMYEIAWELIDSEGFFFVNFGDIASQSMTRGLTGVDGQCIYLMAAEHYRLARTVGWALYAARVWLKPFNRLQRPYWTYKTSIPHHQEYEHLWTWAKSAEGDEQELPDDWAYAWTWRKAGVKTDQRFDWKMSSRAVWDTRKEATDDKPLTRHVAAFPVCLPERALRAHSDYDAIVWEPFSGSGTTLVACERLSRVCRAGELSPGYVAATLERLAGMGLEPKLVAF